MTFRREETLERVELLLKDWRKEISKKNASGYVKDIIKSLHNLQIAVCIKESLERREKRASSFYRLISEDPGLSESELGKKTIQIFSDYVNPR